jgi:hypothetical protein
MAEGAPLTFDDLQLVSVSFAPVPAGRFELPAKPRTAQEYQQIIGGVSIGPAALRRPHYALTSRTSCRPRFVQAPLPTQGGHRPLAPQSPRRPAATLAE